MIKTGISALVYHFGKNGTDAEHLILQLIYGICKFVLWQDIHLLTNRGEMSGKIKKGCKAIIIGTLKSPCLGAFVDVGDFIGKIPGLNGEDRWHVSIYLYGKKSFFNPDGIGYSAREKYLQRIDTEPEFEKHEQEEEV
jgi:hypothetical protein